MKPENAALVEAKLNATGVRIVNALYADETMDTLMDAAREEGRQSAGERVKALEEGLKDAAAWHDGQSDDLGKFPQNADLRWRRHQHVEEFERIQALLSSAQGETKEGFDGLPELPCGEPVGATAALAVTDEMVERGAAAVCRSLMGGACPVRPRHRDTARACLEAALQTPPDQGEGQ